MKIKEPINKNYCASVVTINILNPLAGCDNVVGANIFGNNVIVSKDTKVGDIGLFFPLETELSAEFLRENNLYRDPTLNIDANKKGYFELNGRIRAIKFRGHKSEGFFIPLDSLNYLKLNLSYLIKGVDFDELDGHKVCQKHIPRRSVMASRGEKRSKADKKLKRISRLVENQFKFHIDMNSVA